MKSEDFKKITDDMQEKIGKEKASLIADNMAKILSDNLQVNQSLADKDKEIERLKQEKENLMNTNMNLLQQIPMGEDSSFNRNKKQEKEDIPNPEAFDYKSVFDENGNFIN